MPRIRPVDPPYAPAVAERLGAMMPPGVPPIRLFRTFVRNMEMATAMARWGGYELGRRLSLTRRDREIVIDRTCARCRCEYEWGVHVAYFAEQAGLSPAQVASLAHGDSADGCWSAPRDRLLVDAVDALHDDARLGDRLYGEMAAEFSDAQLLDLFMLCGWYHAISYAANGAAVELEDGAPRFDDAR